MLDDKYVRGNPDGRTSDRRPPPDGLGFSIGIITEISLGSSTAVALADEADLAFHASGRGRVGVIDTVSTARHRTPVAVRNRLILGLATPPSGQLVAVGADDGTAELIRIRLTRGNLSAEPLTQFRYLIPPDGPGIMAFENEAALWHQDEDGHLVRLLVDTRTRHKRLTPPGEVTSMVIRDQRLYYSVWQRRRCVLFAYDIRNAVITANRQFDGTDVVLLRADETGLVAGAARPRAGDYEVHRLGPDLETLATLTLPLPAAAVCQTDDRLLILPEYRPDVPICLWDGNHPDLPPATAPPAFGFAPPIALKRNVDGTLTAASTSGIIRFNLGEGTTGP